MFMCVHVHWIQYVDQVPFSVCLSMRFPFSVIGLHGKVLSMSRWCRCWEIENTNRQSHTHLGTAVSLVLGRWWSVALGSLWWRLCQVAAEQRIVLVQERVPGLGWRAILSAYLLLLMLVPEERFSSVSTINCYWMWTVFFWLMSLLTTSASILCWWLMREYVHVCVCVL